MENSFFISVHRGETLLRGLPWGKPHSMWGFPHKRARAVSSGYAICGNTWGGTPLPFFRLFSPADCPVDSRAAVEGLIGFVHNTNQCVLQGASGYRILRNSTPVQFARWNDAAI